MEKTKSNKLVCDLCRFVVPGRAQSSPLGPEVSELPPLTSLTASNCYWAGGLESWLEILFNVFEQKKARYSTAAQAKSHNPLYKGIDAVHTVCVLSVWSGHGQQRTTAKLNVDPQLFPRTLYCIFLCSCNTECIYFQIRSNVLIIITWRKQVIFTVCGQLIKVLKRVSVTDMLTTSW